jgi:recombination protein RecT
VTANAGGALAKRDEKKNSTPAERGIMDVIRQMEPQFQAAMPRGFEAVQLTRDAFTLIRKTPLLARCTQASVLGGLMNIAQLGLRAGVLGQAWLIPFQDKQNKTYQAQLVIGYKGYVELAHRSPNVAGIVARTAYENDVFEVELGTSDRIVHKPLMTGNRGKPIAHYAVVKFTNGGHTFWWMTEDEMDEHRLLHAGSPNKGPWRDNRIEMSQKTVIRKLSRFMPQATELATAVAVDETVRVNLDGNAAPVDASKFVDGEIVEEEPAAQAPAETVEEPPGW